MFVLLDCSLPGSSSVGFSRQEHWSRLPFPSLGDIPDPGIKHASPALQVDSLPLSHLWSPSKSLIPVTTQGYGGSGDGRQLNSISWRREYLYIYIYIFFFFWNSSVRKTIFSSIYLFKWRMYSLVYILWVGYLVLCFFVLLLPPL